MFARSTLLHHGTRAALLAALGFAIAANAAQAATYEQVSRASGPAGAAPFAPDGALPRLTGDDGRHAYFTTFSPKDYSPVTPFGKVVGRDALTNVTTPFRGGPDGRTIIRGWDAAEKQILALRFDLSTGYQHVLAPASGGPERVVFSDADFENPDVQITGDGKSLVFSSGQNGTRIQNLATGAVRQIDARSLSIGRASLSDDGSVIAGISYDAGQPVGGYFRAGTFTPLPGSAVVSANGRAVAYLAPGEPAVLHVRSLPSGAETTSPVPAVAGAEPGIQWISPDGKRVVVAPRYSPAPNGAQAFDVGPGRWNTFGGVYSGSIGGDEFTSGGGASSSISRSGRYATVRYQGQVALVDLTGRQLAGGGDPLSASSYFRPTTTRECNWNQDPAWVDTSATVATFERPAPWVPKPLAATVTVSFDGKVAKSRALTKSVTPLGYGEPPLPAASLSVPVPQSATTVAVKTTVVDHAGRVVTGTKTETLEPCTS